MSTDSINDEIRSVRRDLAAQFDNDLEQIIAHVRKTESESDREYHTLPPRLVKPLPPTVIDNNTPIQ